MLRTKVLPEVLGQIVGDGIHASMLLTLDGALMGSVGAVASADADVDHKVVGAIAAHTWGEYLHAGRELDQPGELEGLVIELETGRIALAPAGKGFLLCAYSDGTDDAAPVGLLKAKVEALGSYLSTSLDQIQV